MPFIARAWRPLEVIFGPVECSHTSSLDGLLHLRLHGKQVVLERIGMARPLEVGLRQLPREPNVVMPEPMDLFI